MFHSVMHNMAMAVAAEDLAVGLPQFGVGRIMDAIVYICIVCTECRHVI